MPAGKHPALKVTWHDGMKDGKPHLDPHDSFISKPGESADLRRETYNESAAWYESFTKTLFAKDVQATAGKAH